MCYLLSQWQELSNNTQYARVQLDQSGLGSSHPTPTHNWHHNCHNHGCRWQKWPPNAPHEALRSVLMHQMDGWQTSKLVDIIWGGLRVCMALKCSFVPSIMHHASPQHQTDLKAMDTLNIPKLIPACSGGCCPSIWCIGKECKASHGVQGGHFRWQWPWLAMVVLVDVGHWRRMSDWPDVAVVKNVCGSVFFLCRYQTFLTFDPAAKKGSLRPLHFSLKLVLMLCSTVTQLPHVQPKGRRLQCH